MGCKMWNINGFYLLTYLHNFLLSFSVPQSTACDDFLSAAGTTTTTTTTVVVVTGIAVVVGVDIQLQQYL